MPFGFPISLPTCDIVPSPTPPDTLAPVDIRGDGLPLLLSQFRGKPRLEGVIGALLDGVQDFVDAALQVYYGRWIDAAVGVQLDGIGALIDLPRSGWPDETYRTLLRAQVLVLRSDGEWPDIFAVLAAVGITSAAVHDVDVAAMRVDLGVPFGDQIGAADTFDLLERTRAGGVRLSLVFPTIAITDAFTLADTTPAVDARRGSGDAVAGLVGGELASMFATTGAA